MPRRYGVIANMAGKTSAGAASEKSRQPYFGNWTYDARIFTAAVLVALPAICLLVLVLFLRDLSAGLIGALIAVAALATLWLAVRLRNQVIYPLYTLSNLLEAFRARGYSLRGQRAIQTNEHILAIWKAEFHEYYERGALFGLIMHPQAIGRPSRLVLLREFIKFVRTYPDVWFATGTEVANHVLKVIK